MQAGATHDADEIGVRTPGAARRSPSSARARSATSSPASRTSARPAPARRSPTRPPGAAEPLDGLPRPEADGVLRPLPDRRRRLRGPARGAREAEAQRRSIHLRRPRRRARSASASAAASSACCTWRSCGSGSSASSTSRSSPPRRRSSTGCTRTDGDASSVDNPADMPRPQRDRVHRGAVLHGHDPHARRTYTGTLMELCQTAARRDGEARVPVARAGRAASTGSRWPRWSSTSSTS